MLRQHVRLTGLDSQNFLQNRDTLDVVNAMFRDATPGEPLEVVTYAQYEGDFAMDTHTRYLTERRLAPGVRHIPFPPEIDPHHVLEDARDIHFIRTGDNVVEYGVLRPDETGGSA